MYDDDTYYADGYVSMAEPGCTGYAEDGSRLRWMAVPTEDGGSEYQCVSYSTQRNRTVTEIEVPEEPVAEAPPVAEPETTGVGPANEPAVASPPPAAPATGCELLIYSETNFKGLSARPQKISLLSAKMAGRTRSPRSKSSREPGTSIPTKTMPAK